MQGKKNVYDGKITLTGFYKWHIALRLLMKGNASNIAVIQVPGPLHHVNERIVGFDACTHTIIIVLKFLQGRMMKADVVVRP